MGNNNIRLLDNCDRYLLITDIYGHKRNQAIER